MSTEPMTEKNPFTAHAHATYSSPCSVSARDAAEPERHEHAEAQAERGEHDDRERRRAPRGRSRAASRSRIGGERELVEDREHGEHREQDGHGARRPGRRTAG